MTQDHKSLLNFFRDCSKNYLDSIREKIPEFPAEYIYPTGNPIRPVLPVQIAQNKVMVIGAFPSARFQYINGKLVPVADNLAPFAKEEYFDGRGFRKQASRESLEKNFFGEKLLNISFDDMWLTDLVKVYLFPAKHIKNCVTVTPKREYVNTHNMFKKIAISSLDWMHREIKLCNPKLIITLGEIPARVLQDDWKTKSIDLLTGLQAKPLSVGDGYRIAHLAHPEIRRINPDWDKRSKETIKKLRRQLETILK
jgi:hypothetical protein